MQGMARACTLAMFSVVLMTATGSVLAGDAFKQGDKVEARWGSEWKAATIIAVKPGTPRPFKVHFTGYDSSRDNWVTAVELRTAGTAPASAAPAVPAAAAGGATYKQGDVVEGRMGADWKRATVLAVKASAPKPYLVHFEGYDSQRDNWFAASELREAGAAPAPAAAPAASAGKYKEGDKVEALYGSTWMKATIVQVKAGQPRPWYVRYDGLDSSRDKQLDDHEVRPAGDLWIVVEKGADDGSGAFKAGQAVQLQEGTAWNLVHVVQVKNKRFFVSAEGAQSLKGEWVEASRLRALAENKEAAKLVAEGLVTNVLPDVNYTGDVKVGDSVEIYMDVGFGERWTKCTVQEIKGDEYKVHYGGSQYNVKTVKKEVFRNLQKEATAKRQSLFWTAVGVHRPAVGAFVHAFTREFPREMSDPSPPRNPDDLANALEGLAALDAECRKAAPDALLVSENDKKGWSHNARVWCDVAAAREKLGGEMAKKLLDDAVGGRLAFIRTKVGTVETAVAGGKGIANYTEPVDTSDIFFNGGAKTMESTRATLKKFSSALGGPDATAKIEADFTAAISEAQARFKKNLPRSSFKTATSDATIEKAARGYLSRNFPGAQPLKSGVESKSWKFEKTDKGVTLARLKWADVLWKDPAHNVCCVGGFLYNEEALVKGGFESPGFITDSYGYVFTWSYQRCP